MGYYFKFEDNAITRGIMIKNIGNHFKGNKRVRIRLGAGDSRVCKHFGGKYKKLKEL